jgi:two-component system KDP operon response regulator KdpE
MNGSSTARPVTALIVDDEPQMRRLLTLNLEANAYQVVVAEKGQEALTLAAQYRPDIILLDLGLPDLDGQIVLQRLREWCATPVIILTVKDAQAEKIAALDAGADDYVTKPFHSGELLARMRAALRHVSAGEEESVFKSGDLLVDLANRRVTRRGEEVKLTATEYSLLRLFVRHAGKVLTHQQILREVWGPGHDERTHYLRVYMAHLREKLENNPARPPLFVTEPGIGYRLSD